MADIVDEIVESLVAGAEAHVLAARPTQQVQSDNSQPSDVSDASGANNNHGAEDRAEHNRDSAAIASAAGYDTEDVRGPEALTSGRNRDSRHQMPDVSPTGMAQSSSDNAPATEQQPSRQQQLNQNILGGVLGKIDAPESVAKNSKLLALKQRRLGSLSSSLDLSRESSFDGALQHAAHNEGSSSLQNSFAAAEAPDSLAAEHGDLNEQAASSLAPLPLDSTTGNT